VPGDRYQIPSGNIKLSLDVNIII